MKKCIHCSQYFSSIVYRNENEYCDYCNAIIDDIKALKQMIIDMEYELFKRQNESFEHE